MSFSSRSHTIRRVIVISTGNRAGVILSPIAHLQYGWWFAHWGDFNRRQRAAIALAGAAPDLDGLSFVAGSEPFHRYHHILFHNLGSVLAVTVLAGLLFWRRPRASVLVAFAFAMHIVEDYATVAWNQYPWSPFSPAAVNLSDHLPGWVVQGVLQVAAMVFIVAMTVWIYLRHRRTPLEILSPAIDRLVVNYAVLPWRMVCSQCARRAHFRCDGCDRAVCATHAEVGRGLQVRCAACAQGSAPW